MINKARVLFSKLAEVSAYETLANNIATPVGNAGMADAKNREIIFPSMAATRRY
ncbi:hypothetical protein [Methylomonas rapida]|uniref:Uncharacterized protein n=1 Tax=Methylomonas rapida TaxID=2963939 RepID=A0ABY7GD16_9GAMM|nr:hypothetical protein [Methylomonas rapida]WAR43182.1 hypothetical protein NM686_012335 [Methylomonas rapida]